MTNFVPWNKGALMTLYPGSCGLPTAFSPCRSKIKTKIEVIHEMAIYHLHMQVITRGVGKSAVAAAAYRSGDALTNENEGTSFDYSRKGGVVHTEIILPEHAPQEFAERSVLWNAVEKVENQHNSQLAREMDIALPYELTPEQNLALVREYVKRTFVAAGMCADIAIHEPDYEIPNPHAHIMLTMRPINEDGTWGQKVRKINGKRVYTTDWNDRGKSEVWRKAWGDVLNEFLERYGHAARVDHRSFERQGVEQIPTVHLGVSVTQMERRGIVTDRGNLNREIEITNSQIRQIRARVNKLKSWCDAEKANTPPPLYEVFNAILNPGEERSHYKQLADLKLAAKTLVFIQQNNINDLPALADKVSVMHRDCNDAYDRKKKTERRIKTLDKHVEQSENFKKHRKVRVHYDKLYAEYKTLSKETGLFTKSKTQKAFDAANEYYNEHRSEIMVFDTASKYLKDVLQKRFDPAKITAQMKKWSDERDDCARKLGGINTEYTLYKSDVENAEAIKRFAVKLMIPDEPHERQQQKNKSWEVSH